VLIECGQFEDLEKRMNKPNINLDFLGAGEFRFEEEKKQSQDAIKEQ